MDKWSFLYELQRSFDFDLILKQDEAILKNRSTGACIEIFEETFPSRKSGETYSEYIVCFSTQHQHFEELEDVEDYTLKILRDDVLPIEFFCQGKRCFGSEITKAEYPNLDLDFLADFFGYPPEDLSRFDCEIHSWSGQYDTGLQSLDAIRAQKKTRKE